MTGELIAFFILAIVAIGGGILMLNLTRVIHMVVALVFTFLSIAGLFIMLTAPFVAVVQVLIYSGGVTIIMLFGIMLTKHNATAEAVVSRWRSFFAGLGVIVFFLLMFFGINHLNLGGTASNLQAHNTEKIGMSLYTDYIIPFEITSVLLLVALIGAIVLAKRDDDGEEKKDE